MLTKRAKVSGPKGFKADKIWAEALRRAVLRWHGQKKNGKPMIDIVATKVVAKAAKGDMFAARELGDRLDGKASQQIDMRIIRGWEDLSEEELVMLARGGKDK